MTLPRYEEYKDSSFDWLGQVPTHWPIKRLRFVAELNPSKSELAVLDRATQVSFLPMEAIGDDGSINLERTRPIAEVETGYTYFRDGDVVVAKITPCFENGKGALIQGLEAGIGFGTTELIVTRPNQLEVLGPFLNWVFRSPSFRARGEASMYGAGGQKRVPDEFVRNLRWSFPSLDEQAVIAAFLDRETAKIDALIAEQEKLIALLAEKRQAIISRVVTRGLAPDAPMKDSGVAWLGEVPAHWEVRSISSFSTKITNGYVGPTRGIFASQGVRYLQSLHIKCGHIIFDVPYYVSEEWSQEHKKSVLAIGDVLVVQTGDIGQVATVDDEFAGSNCHALIIISPVSDVVNGNWISLVLNSNFGQHSLLSIQTGALHPHLNCGNVRGLYVPVPPVREQLEIALFVKNQSAKLDVLQREVEHAIVLFKERRSALIAAAVTGQIDVRGSVTAETP